MRREEKHGRLRSAVHRKKLIDRWTFYSPVLKGNAEPFVADVYLRNRNGSETPEFEALLKIRPAEIIRGSNIDELFGKVEERFRVNDLARHSLKWENWIELQIGGYVSGSEGERAAALDITYSIIKRALDPKTGRHVTINHNHIVVDFPSPKKAGEKDPDAKDDSRFSGRSEENQYAYIPATKENRAAVAELLNKMRALRSGLNALLHQQVIEATLSNVRALPFKDNG